MRLVGVHEVRRNLSALLDEVGKGEMIDITKRGVLIAQLLPVGVHDSNPVREVIADLRAYRERLRLRGLSVRKLTEEGRR